MLDSSKNCSSSPADLDFGKEAGEHVCGSRSVSVCARGCGSACPCMRVRRDVSRQSHTYWSFALSFAPTVVSLLWDGISLCGSAWPGTQQSSSRHDRTQAVSQYLFPGSLVLVLTRWFQILTGVGRKSECWVGKEKLGSVCLVFYLLHWWVERRDPTCDCQGGDPPVWPSEKLLWSTVYRKWFTENKLGDLFILPSPKSISWLMKRNWKLGESCVEGAKQRCFLRPTNRDEDKAFCYLLTVGPCWAEPEREESAFALIGCWP